MEHDLSPSALADLRRPRPYPAVSVLTPTHRRDPLSTEDAVRTGIAGSAGTVTSAAIVMVMVFGVFATLSFIDFKEMGIGLAVAILIDATIIRGVLLPAAMKLLGDWNWYLPRWLEWLPRVDVEGSHFSKEPVGVPATPPIADAAS